MRILLISIFINIAMAVNAQSVLGIPFGSDYTTTKELLAQRFGKYSVHEDNGTLMLYDFRMGDFSFSIGRFIFQYNGSKSYLNSAEFQTHYDASSTSAAKQSRDYLFSLIKPKYEDDYIEEYINDDGFKCYRFGINPMDDNRALGVVALERGKGRDGKERLYLHLIYFPIEYISASSDF